MREILCAVLLALLLFPLGPLRAGDPPPVSPSAEVEPGKEAPDWEARFKKDKGHDIKEEKRDQRKEMKKERKKERKDEEREQKKEQRRDLRQEHHRR